MYLLIVVTEIGNAVVTVDPVITVGTTAAAAANAGPSTGPAPPVVPVDIDNSDGESATTSLTLQQRMELAMKASMAQPLDNCKLNDKSMQAAIKSEMAVFERSGVRGRSLQLVYSHLLSIPPTSVEAERAFSSAGLLCTRIRSRLGDDTLDTLCFLRSYYGNSKNKK